MKIYKQFENMTAAHKALFAIKIDNVTIMESDTTIGYIRSKYGIYNTLDDIEMLWTLYATMTADDLKRSYNAFYSTYNPTDNYNGHEVNIYLNQHGMETETRTDDTTETNTANDVTGENYITTFDSTTYRNSDKTKQTGSTDRTNTGTVTTEKTHDTTTLTVDGTTYTADNVTAEIKDKAGNLGVTRTQEMILDEINLRFTPYIQRYIDNFIAQYAFLLLTDGGCSNDSFFLYDE